MKLSNYNIELFENGVNILYNTLTRKYVLYDDSKISLLEQAINNLNKGEYSFDEFEIIQKLIQKGIVIKDHTNELEKIQYIEKTVRYNKNILFLVIQPTLNCNFRCTYCYEEHKLEAMEDETEENIIKFVEKNKGKYRGIHIGWFGGEPLLEKERIINLTNRIKPICKDAGLRYTSSMTTNGYLFDDDFIEKIEELHIKKIQVTVDGEETEHNKLRPLMDGSGTYKWIMENIFKILEKDVLINLRINIADDNDKNIENLLERIPSNKRGKINVYISNLFQTSNAVNLFDIYKMAIEKGYNYPNTTNVFHHCEVCTSGITIEPSGKVVPCSMAGEQGLYYGNINNEGVFVIKNENLYYKIKNVSALDNKSCKACKQLPICMGGCKLARSQNPDVCNGVNGLSKEDKMRLHYYYDLKHGYIKEADYL